MQLSSFKGNISLAFMNGLCIMYLKWKGNRRLLLVKVCNDNSTQVLENHNGNNMEYE